MMERRLARIYYAFSLLILTAFILGANLARADGRMTAQTQAAPTYDFTGMENEQVFYCLGRAAKTPAKAPVNCSFPDMTACEAQERIERSVDPSAHCLRVVL